MVQEEVQEEALKVALIETESDAILKIQIEDHRVILVRNSVEVIAQREILKVEEGHEEKDRF